VEQQSVSMRSITLQYTESASMNASDDAELFDV
jgi:hypothetical protein